MSAPKDMDLVFKAQQLQQHLITKGMIKDRKYKLKTYKECFIAKDIIPIIIELKLIPLSTTNKNENESMAIKFGNDLMQSDIIQHVTKAHMFKNEKLFYKFIPGYNNKPKKHSIADILDIPKVTPNKDNEDQKQEEEQVVAYQVQGQETTNNKNVDQSPLSPPQSTTDNLLSPSSSSPGLQPSKVKLPTKYVQIESLMTSRFHNKSKLHLFVVGIGLTQPLFEWFVFSLTFQLAKLQTLAKNCKFHRVVTKPTSRYKPNSTTASCTW